MKIVEEITVRYETRGGSRDKCRTPCYSYPGGGVWVDLGFTVIPFGITVDK